MSQGLKQGKRPLSQKNVQLREEDLFGNPLSIPPSLAAEFKAQGVEARFIDAKKLYENHGYHAKGWVPYKRSTAPTSSDTIETSEFKSGSDPDGTFRRGTLVLATRSIEVSNKHRTLNKQKADRQKGYTKQKAAELRQMAKEAFQDAKRVIFEGYEDEQGTEDSDDSDE